ncbi:unknown [Alistipes sp. CAG:157]|nr:unknown [Alistipes sp. CAG:157]
MPLPCMARFLLVKRGKRKGGSEKAFLLSKGVGRIVPRVLAFSSRLREARAREVVPFV